MPLMATFDPSGASLTAPLPKGRYEGRTAYRTLQKVCALPHSYAVNVAETDVYILSSIHVITIPQRPSTTHP